MRARPNRRIRRSRFERASGRIKVERVICAYDCGQMINPANAVFDAAGARLRTVPFTPVRVTGSLSEIKAG